MEEDHKFFVTPNRIMDADTVVDAEYVPDGSGGGKAEFRLCFKTGEAMTLSGEAADAAWESFQESTTCGRERKRLELFKDLEGDDDVLTGGGRSTKGVPAALPFYVIVGVCSPVAARQTQLPVFPAAYFTSSGNENTGSTSTGICDVPASAFFNASGILSYFVIHASVPARSP